MHRKRNNTYQSCRIHPSVMVGDYDECSKCKELRLNTKKQTSNRKDIKIKNTTTKKTLHSEKQSKLNKYARRMRNAKTPSEKKFERLLKNVGVKFKSQKIVAPNEKNHGGYILDFYVKHPYRICFEIDGEYHNNRLEKDKYRDNWLWDNMQIRTIRLKNNEVNTLTVNDLHNMINEFKVYNSKN